MRITEHNFGHRTSKSKCGTRGAPAARATWLLPTHRLRIHSLESMHL